MINKEFNLGEFSRDELLGLAYTLAYAVTKSQDVLAEYILPDSQTHAGEACNKLLEILDDQALVKTMKEFNILIEGKQND